MPPQDSAATDTSAAPKGWAKKTLPDGSTGYFPDDQTDDQIHRIVLQQPGMGDIPAAVSAGVDAMAPEGTKRRSAIDWIWNPKISQQQASEFWANVLTGESTEKLKEAEGGPPSRKASSARAGKVLSDIAGGVTSSFTSPGQIALTAFSGGDWLLDKAGGAEAIGLGKYLQPLLRMPGKTSMAWFGLQGLGAMIGPRQEGESDDDFLERRVMGATAFLGSAHAVGGGINAALKATLVNTFGLDEDLAGKVADRVDKLEKLRADRDTRISSIEAERDAKLDSLDSDTRRTIAGFESQLDRDMNELQLVGEGQKRGVDKATQLALDASKGRITDLQRQQFHAGSQIISDTVRVIREMEGDRDIEGAVKKPFREIGEQIKKPVTDENNIRHIIEGAVTDRGAKIDEIPPSVYKSLTKISPEMRDYVRDDPSSKIGDVSFNDLSRIRDDLYNAAASAKDGTMRGAFYNAYDQVTAIQEKAAEDAGMGGKYKRAKADYLQFKRGLGSGMMQKWLSSEDVQHQDMQAKVGRLIAQDDETTKGAMSRAIRTTLKAAGIDVGPLDQLSRQIAAEEEGVPKRVTDIGKMAKKGISDLVEGQQVELKRGTKAQIDAAKGMSKEQADAADAEARAAVQKARDEYDAARRPIERHPVISGYATEELAGKSNEELYRIRLGEIAQREGGRGISVTPIVMTIYGLLHASAFPFLYGMARGGIPELVKQPAFQDWLIEKSGVKPNTPEANRLRRAISQMGPVLKRMERTGIPQSAAMSTVHGEMPSRKDDQRYLDDIPSREDVTQPTQ